MKRRDMLKVLAGLPFFGFLPKVETDEVRPIESEVVRERQPDELKTRKLKAVWSLEAQQDLRSWHNLDAEAELTAVLAQEISLEIDREVLADLRTTSFKTFKAETILESGYFYSPYIPLVSTPVALDPESFTPKNGIMTRYGEKLLDKQLYGKVTL